LTLTTAANASSIQGLGAISAGEATAYRERLLDRQPLTLDDLPPLLVNDFEPLLFGHFPQLGEIRRALLAAGARAAPMSGSGPTLVGLFASQAEARAARDQVSRRAGVVAFVARTLSEEDSARSEGWFTPLQQERGKRGEGGHGGI
jgi:hypothetical protein